MITLRLRYNVLMLIDYTTPDKMADTYMSFAHSHKIIMSTNTAPAVNYSVQIWRHLNTSTTQFETLEYCCIHANMITDVNND